MALKKLYIFVEGADDILFFKSVFVPIFLEKYDDVEIIQYAQMKRVKVDLFITSIITLGFDYIIAADIDAEPTVMDKKKFVKHKFEVAEMPKIAIVIQEIESWYLAGITNEFIKKMGLYDLPETNQITKEDFNQYYIKSYHSRIDFMQETLKHYSVDLARERNESFNFFFQKYCSWFFNNKMSELG